MTVPPSAGDDAGGRRPVPGDAGRPRPLLAHGVAGAGPAVLLLHAGVADRRMWEPQSTVLASAGYRVVLGDLRGFGDSPVVPGRHSDAEDVVDLLDALGETRAAVVAASYGGRVALEVAARWPDRVPALVLLCAGAPGHEPREELRAFGQREDALVEAGDVAGAVELNVETWLGPEADGATRDLVRRMQRHAFDVQLAAEAAGVAPVPAETDVDLSAVRARCLSVSGAHDLTDFREIAASLPRRLGGGARHVELGWAGHLPSLERPDEVTDLLVAFLAEAWPPRAPDDRSDDSHRV